MLQYYVYRHTTSIKLTFICHSFPLQLSSLIAKVLAGSLNSDKMICKVNLLILK